MHGDVIAFLGFARALELRCEVVYFEVGGGDEGGEKESGKGGEQGDTHCGGLEEGGSGLSSEGIGF